MSTGESVRRVRAVWRARVAEVQALIAWTELPRVRQAVVQACGLIAVSAVVGVLTRLARGTRDDNLVFLGLAGFTAVLAAAVLVSSRKLLAPRLWLLYGVPATASSCALLLLAMMSRSNADISGTLSLVPAVAGSWFAVWWASTLHSHGLTGADLAEATTTIRGAAAIWNLLVVLTLAQVGLAIVGWDVPLGDGLESGVAGFFSFGAAFTYAGPGWSEYRRGLATAERKPVAALPPATGKQVTK